MKTEIPSFPLSSSSVAPRFGVSGVGCYCGWRGDVWFLCVPKGLVASHHLACGLVFNDGHGVVECVRMLRFHLDSTDSTNVSCQAVRCSLCDFIYAKELWVINCHCKLHIQWHTVHMYEETHHIYRIIRIYCQREKSNGSSIVSLVTCQSYSES